MNVRYWRLAALGGRRPKGLLLAQSGHTASNCRFLIDNLSMRCLAHHGTGDIAHAVMSCDTYRADDAGSGVSAKDDWFRLPCLTDEAKAEFESRLSRSRSSRYEYMRIQASALVEASAFEQALMLIDRIIAEKPDYTLAAWIWEQRADCLRKMNRSKEAIADYIKAIEVVKAHPGVQGNAHLSLASLVYGLKQSDFYETALGLLTDFWDAHPIFPRHEFQQFGMTALLLNALGETEEAKPAARRALAAAAKERSNAANHRGLGLVGNTHQQMRKELEAIVGGQPFRKPTADGRTLMMKLQRVTRRILGTDS